ncbi:thioesterase family protein [Candidatus Chlorohelix sp.]|uniref:thioesterase family protein n=1 Tax=Candidatus Chlorohelix sp. TaxID=3139201 RepID=UPI003024B2EE
MDSFWIDEGNDMFQPTIHTQGPWDARFQHGGPPGALLIRQLENCSPRPDTVLARISIDIFGPVPLAPLRAHAHLVRPGRSVEKLEALLEYEGRTVMRATGWRIRIPNERPTQAEEEIKLPEIVGLPESAPETDPTQAPGWGGGFIKAIEWHFVHGGLEHPGPATVWLRMRYPLLAGEETSPMQRLILSADSANGASGPLDIREWQFIPPELTIHSLRPPTGEWICLEASTLIQTEGVGLTNANLYDLRGLVGRSAQALLIARKES